MSCSNPMIAVQTGFVNPETGKMGYRFLGSVKKMQIPDDHWREDGEPRSFFYWSKDSPAVDLETGELLSTSVVLPCGQCLECRTSYAAHWADRILLEAQFHEQSYFVTLTYDEDHVPLHVAKDGEVVMSLEPKELQDFIKRLRDHCRYNGKPTIRYYAVGEYGSLHHRPHYHLIIFGLILDDLRVIGRNKTGRVLHSSEFVEDCWKFGRVEVDHMTWEAAAYCARYCVKKLGKKETGFYEDHGLVPEFTRCSRDPAIGAKYLEGNMERIYLSDEIIIPTGDGMRKVKPPKYFDKKYDDVYPEGFAKVKENRKKIAKEQIKLRMDRFSGSYLELLDNQHRAFTSKIKTLRRELE